MQLELTDEQRGLRDELRAYFGAMLPDDVRYALGQLRNLGDTGRAVRALEQAEDRLADLCERSPAGDVADRAGPATPENAGTRFPAGWDPFA